MAGWSLSQMAVKGGSLQATRLLDQQWNERERKDILFVVAARNREIAFSIRDPRWYGEIFQSNSNYD